jgi:hypothetical protein
MRIPLPRRATLVSGGTCASIPARLIALEMLAVLRTALVPQAVTTRIGEIRVNTVAQFILVKQTPHVV